MRDLLWAPVFSWPVLASMLGAIALAIAWSLWRGLHSPRRALVLGVFRLLALLLLGLILAQPRRRFDEVTILKPQLAVLVDTSESMSDAVDDAQSRRAERAREWLESPVLKGVRESFEVRLFGFDARLNELSAQPAELTFQGGSSNVMAALNQVRETFRGQPLAAILLLSDGLESSAAARESTLSGSVPIHTFELEKPFKPREKGRLLSLGAVDFPARVVVGWDSEIRANVIGSGLSGKTVGVELWREGKLEKQAAVSFNEEEQTRAVTFPVAAEKPGMIPYELRVLDAAADVDAQKHSFVIEALAPGKRILHLQNSLGFDFKFLRKAIVSDRNLQLSAFVRWGDGRLVSMGERGVPSEASIEFSAAGLAKYSVVMLGDLAADALKPADYQALKDFVNRGGGLVLLGGRNALTSEALAKSALAEVLPIKLPAEYRETPTSVTITDAGLRHPVFGPLFASIQDFPPLLTANFSAGTSATAEVLMEASAEGHTTPLIALSRFGQGRVVVVMTDTLWRWRLAAKSWNAERSPYDTFFTQLMDWLIPKEQDKANGDRVEVFTERANYLLGERPEVRAILRRVEESKAAPALLPLSVKTPDGKTFQYTLKAAALPVAGGRTVPGYRVEVEPNVPGVFTATASLAIEGGKLEGETRFIVAKPPTELTAKPIDRVFLARIAEMSGGKYHSVEDSARWPADLHFKQQQFARMQVSDLWNRPLLLALFLAALSADWLCRKAWNLP